jgi:Spy/CpxP family protein refolding chaperone
MAQTTMPPAQTTPGQRGGMYGRMLDGITLSDQQREQIQALMAQYRQAHPRGSQPDRQARQQLMQSIRNVLTPAQQAQLDANMARMRANDAPGAPGGRGMGRMMEGITLSAQQQQQIQALIAQFRQAHPPGSQVDAQTREQLRNSIMNVLTPAQRAQYEANRRRLQAERSQRAGNAPFPAASPSPQP